MKPKYFSKIALQSSVRALSLLDRNRYSQSYGCFDKYYWHFKTKDFPSSSYQMGIEFLARLWIFNDEDNPFYKKQILLDWIKAGMEYTCRIQHKDGSFDEWYPNERGWAGPTAYIIHSLISAYKITENELDSDLKNKLQTCFAKAGSCLLKQKEGASLANHSALFLLALYELSQTTSSPLLIKNMDFYIRQFESFVSEEGWSLEYDGPDFGYNLATLSFLARLHKALPHPFLKQYAEKSLRFLSYFFYPDGSFGGLGSRETVQLYPYALNYWGKFFPLAKHIENHLRKKYSYENLRPSDQDDHYLFYRLNDYMEMDEIVSSTSPPETIISQKPDSREPKIEPQSLPFLSKKDFSKYFPIAGLFVQKIRGLYFTANMKKGGGLRIYDIKNEKCLLKNNGWVIQLKNKNLITNNLISPDYKVNIEDNKILVSGRGQRIAQKYFHPFSSALFRLLLLAVRHYKIAFWMKKMVRKQLILRKRKSKYTFKRMISFDSTPPDQKQIKTSKIQQKSIEPSKIHQTLQTNILIEDVIHCPSACKIFYGGGFSIRYVPQSNYFEFSDLQNPTQVFQPKNHKKSLLIKQICSLKSVQTNWTEVDPG